MRKGRPHGAHYGARRCREWCRTARTRYDTNCIDLHRPDSHQEGSIPERIRTSNLRLRRRRKRANDAARIVSSKQCLISTCAKTSSRPPGHLTVHILHELRRNSTVPRTSRTALKRPSALVPIRRCIVRVCLTLRLVWVQILPASLETLARSSAVRAASL